MTAKNIVPARKMVVAPVQPSCRPVVRRTNIVAVRDMDTVKNAERGDRRGGPWL